MYNVLNHTVPRNRTKRKLNQHPKLYQHCRVQKQSVRVLKHVCVNKPGGRFHQNIATAVT